jgi:hypothetical protein
LQKRRGFVDVFYRRTGGQCRGLSSSGSKRRLGSFLLVITKGIGEIGDRGNSHYRFDGCNTYVGHGIGISGNDAVLSIGRRQEAAYQWTKHCADVRKQWQ